MNKVKGHSNLYKKDNVVVNTDKSAYQRAQKRREEKKKMKDLYERMDRIEMLLEKLVNG